MEGPTPVSALIHAATMVTAGVFLVVRCSPLFEFSQVALNLITIVGMTTAVFAASVELVQNDLKKFAIGYQQNVKLRGGMLVIMQPKNSAIVGVDYYRVICSGGSMQGYYFF